VTVDLDSRQARAVQAGPGDLFIAAGAGSGKTRVLTARFIAAVLGDHPYTPSQPDAVLTVTFTEKAAGELSERVRRGLIDAGCVAEARAVSDAWISTIHGMCSRILRSHALDAGIDPRFGVLDQTEASMLMSRVLDEVLGEAISAEPGVVELVEAYSFTVVAEALMSLRSDLAAAGLDVDDLRTMQEREVNTVLEDSTSRARDLAEGFTSIRQTKTTASNAVAASSLAATLAEWVAAAGAGDPTPESSLHGISFRHARSVEGHEELVDAAKDLLEAARMAVAQVEVARHERVLLGLLRRYSAAYAFEKRRRGVLDFEDLQTITAHLLGTRPDIATAYRSRFEMLMVDEFQDTNALQLKVIDGVADENLCTVGDENQSIYSFRHADVEVFRARAERVSERVELDINYRIAPPLLHGLNGLFSHPALLGEHYMVLRPPPDPAPREPWPHSVPRFALTYVDTADSPTDPIRAEAAAVAEQVDRYRAAGVPCGDIAVLMGALSRGRAAAVESELTERGIPAVLAAGGTWFERPEVMQAIALLKVIDNVRDDEALLTVLAGGLTGLQPASLYTMRYSGGAADHGETSRRSGALWEALPEVLDHLPPVERSALSRTIEAVERARRMQGVRPLSETVLEPLLDLEFDLRLFRDGRSGARAWANVMRLVEIADEFESSSPGGLGAFLRHLEKREEYSTGEQEATLDDERAAVRIMSIHAAKGLEFPVVVVSSLSGEQGAPTIATARVDGRYLLGMSAPTESGRRPTLAWEQVTSALSRVREAERVRLFYVACTRARDGLSVVCRTRSDRSAGTSISGILRGVFGMAEAGTLRSASIALGEGAAAEIEVVHPEEPVTGSEGRTAPARTDADIRGSGGQAGMHHEVVSRGAAEPASSEAALTVCTPVPPVSYTSLAAYERCPYHYYLTRIARLEPPPQPGATTALDIGSVLHAVLESAEDESGLVGLIERAGAAARLDDASLRAVGSAARAFLGSSLAERVRGAERVLREEPFLVPLSCTELVGAMDLIAWTGDHALVVDYKTGGSDLAEDEARERYQLQATCYALAALHAGASEGEVVFAELDRDRTIPFGFSSSDEERLRATLEELVAGIAAGRYAPLPAYLPGLCDACPGFGGLCPVSRPARGASA
jgi:ATP-dependent exoDNAse (exonuclease V) beta subunit